MNLKNLLFVAVGVCCAFAASPANALFITGTTTLNANSSSGPTPPPITNVDTINLSTGELFENSYGKDAAGHVLIRTVGVALISTSQTPSHNPLGGPGASLREMVVAFALAGHTTGVVGPTGAVDAIFTSGGLGVWQSHLNETGGPSPAGSVFDPQRPSTWFGLGPLGTTPVTVANLGANALYTAALGAQDDVVPGTGALVAAAAATTNHSSENTVRIQQTQGAFLFDTAFNPGFIATDRLYVTTAQNVDFKKPFTGALADLLTGTTADRLASQGVVNAVSNFFLGTDFATAFKTGSATASDWSPNASSTFVDFSSNFSGNAYPNQVVPEPTSMALLASGSVLAGLFARRRKNAKQA